MSSNSKLLNIIKNTKDKKLIELFNTNTNEILETFYCLSENQPVISLNNTVIDYDGIVDIEIYAINKNNTQLTKNIYACIKFNGKTPSKDKDWDNSLVLKVLPEKIYKFRAQNYRLLNNIHIKASFVEVFIIVKRAKKKKFWEED